MEASVPGTSSATVSIERDPGNAVDIGASGAERRSRRRTAHPTTVSSIGARRSTPSSRSESRALACPRSPGSKGWPGTPSPAGSNEPPPCVVDLATAGLLASSSKSFKPTRSARSPVGRRGPRGFLRRLRCGLASGPSTVVGRRSYRNTWALMRDISTRMEFATCPLIVTDGLDFYEKVIRRVFGPAVLLGQVLKTRRHDRIVQVDRRERMGASWRFEAGLTHSEDSSTLNTSFIERLNLTIRQGSAYLSRRTLSHARSEDKLEETSRAPALPLQLRPPARRAEVRA